MLVGTSAATPAVAAARHTDKREVEARQAFAAGQYQKALDLYAELYADKVHPTYLRNIGRCYQNLRQPDKAINAFRDYLRQAKDIVVAERDEVESYIREMEQLQREQNAAAPAPSNPSGDVVVQPPLQPVQPATPDHRAGTDVAQVGEPVAPVEPASPPFYKKPWFWGIVGVAVVGGVMGGLWAGGAFSKSYIPCTAANGCN
jgi:hypothetical protein